MITHSKRIIQLMFIFAISFTFIQCDDDTDGNETETVTDIDGNVYTTVRIGNQVWMAENLKVTTFNDGTAITEYNSSSANSWSSFNESIPHFQWQDTSDPHDVYDDSVVLPFDFYGAIYNHFAIESGRLAPTGWRIPTKADYEELVAFIANDGNAGNEIAALKSTMGWDDNSGNGTDLYGFNALASGYANTLGSPTAPGLIANFGTSEYDPVAVQRVAFGLFESAGASNDSYANNSTHLGVAIRCIKE